MVITYEWDAEVRERRVIDAGGREDELLDLLNLGGTNTATSAPTTACPWPVAHSGPGVKCLGTPPIVIVLLFQCIYM